MSFRGRVFLALAVVLAVNAALVVFVTIDQARRAFEREDAAQLGIALSVAASAVEGWGETLLTGVRAVADRADVEQLLARAHSGEIASDDPDLVGLARRVRSDERDTVYILAADGTVLSAAPEVTRFGTSRADLAAAASTAGDAPFAVRLDGVPFLAGASRMPDGSRVVVLHAVTDARARDLATRVGADVTVRWGPVTVSSTPGAYPAASEATVGIAGGRGSVSVARRSDVLAELRGDLLRTVPIVVGLSWLALWPLAFFIARRLGRPVEALTRATERVAVGDWERPVAVAGGSREFDTLIASFNEMQHELVRQRGELARAERAGAWRDAARRMAHEIKNALTPIQLAWERVRRVSNTSTDAGSDSGDLQGYAESVEQELSSLRQLLTAFRDLAEWPAPARRRVDVTELAGGVVDLYAPTTRASLAVQAREPLFAEVDPGQISRATSNLVQNAIDAVGDRGTISVRVVGEEKTVTIEVVDDGPGIADEEQRDVFLPYHTTKPTGTGLGLAIVERIVDAHGGDVAFDSAPGRGTRVTMTLPRGANGG